MNKKFEKLYDKNRIFTVSSRSLLSAPVDAIVNPANQGLSHGGGLAELILLEAGTQFAEECDEIIRTQGRLSITKAVMTTAGQLPYRGIVNAVGPIMGDGNEQLKIEITIINCLQIVDQYQLESIAFPAISTGIFCVPKDVCARAFDKAIPHYWEKFPNSVVKNIWLCLIEEDYSIFEKILNKDKLSNKESPEVKDDEIPTYELKEENTELKDDFDISDWLVRK